MVVYASDPLSTKMVHGYPHPRTQISVDMKQISMDMKQISVDFQGSIDHCSSGDTSAGFATVILAGAGAMLSWSVQLRVEFASDDELDRAGELVEGQKRPFTKDFSQQLSGLVLKANPHNVFKSEPGDLNPYLCSTLSGDTGCLAHYNNL